MATSLPALAALALLPPSRPVLRLAVAAALQVATAAIVAALAAGRLRRPLRRLRRSSEALTAALGREQPARQDADLDELAAGVGRLAADVAEQRAGLLGEKRQLEGVLEAMVEGVLVVDAGRRILQINAALLQMFGLARTPLGRTTLEALRHPGVEEILARAAAARGGAAGVVRLSHPTERHLEVGVAPLEGGMASGAVAVFHDITRLHKLEAVRRDFVANVSHEIRTPVTAIRGYGETLLADGGDAEQRARFAGIIIRHADRLTHLIDDLLVLSSLESADDVLRPERVGAGDLLASVEEAFRLRAADRGVALETGTVEPGIALRADRRLLEQVLGNLVDNALKYTEPGGRVSMEALAAGPLVRFRVRDTGAGIPAADLERVFERFFRVDRGRSRKLGGTGLGLAIVKHIVLLHGGKVRVRSRLGEGSEFTVELPAAGPPGGGAGLLDAPKEPGYVPAATHPDAHLPDILS